MIEVRSNGQILDVKTGERMKYIKQVADVSDVSTVNMSTTMSFKLPKSPKNVQAMEMLGFSGNGSQIPYQKVPSQLLENGVPFIKSGWLQLRSTDDYYNVNIVDGIIDFYKAIEGKKLGEDVDLSELNHTKTVQTVIDSFDNEYYTYLVNHYGGKTVLPEIFLSPFNIDYLVPSARIQHLWQKIHQTFGFTYSGAIFDNEDFVNAWITYPKTNSELISQNVANFEVDELPFGIRRWIPNEHGLEFNLIYNIPFTNEEILLPGFVQVAVEPNRLRSILITQTNNYQFKLNFSALAGYRFRLIINGNVTGVEEAPLKIVVFKNGTPIDGGVIIADSEELLIPISTQSGDVISFRIFALTHQEFNSWRVSQELEPLNTSVFRFYQMEYITWSSFELSIDQVEYAESDFNNTFKDFDIKSFIREVMWRFALVPIIDQETNNIAYHTIDELLNEENGVIDWSSKYIKRKNEYYTLGSYAQKNYFKHKYNTEEANYRDGSIDINNKNLNDEFTVLTSKIYAPENNTHYLTRGFGQVLPVIPTLIWQLEAKEGSTGEIEISYKGLTGRYYWLKKDTNNSSALFTSQQLGDTQESNGFNVASVLNTTFSDLVPKYHQGHTRLFNDLQVLEIELAISIVDVINLDFTRLYYFEQEASYFKLNRLNYEPGKNATGEFLRVKRPTI